jgi:hypothetical protein
MKNEVELFRNICFMIFVCITVPTFIILINKMKRRL